ncbi:hypothetical protein FGG08_001605 [Glutinoglossum americanum]|uniref:Uncharacterized protein n=1 Tax=Glutinoglossum americanum TaxID=1670608 RepID=A0A9P8L555_9PEZI|nr:hypothetical protein FGG08_001605 [Glutinoglossum americanum]
MLSTGRTLSSFVFCDSRKAEFEDVTDSGQGDQVNKSYLEVTGMVVTNPTKDSVHMQQDVLLHSSSIFHPTLDEFPAALFLESSEPNIKPFAYLQLPSVHSTKSTAININQTLMITDMGQFSEYSKTVMNSETFRVALRGQTALHLGKLPSTVVQYNEVLTFKGLNKLTGFNIPTYQIVAAKDGGPNMIGKAFIPNPSIMTLQMGNVTYNIYYNNTFIGTSLLPDLTLKPGNNTVDMRSTVNLKLLQPPPKDGLLHLEVRGNSSIYNGQHLTYYEDALKSNPMHIVLDLAKGMKPPGKN